MSAADAASLAILDSSSRSSCVIDVDDLLPLAGVPRPSVRDPERGLAALTLSLSIPYGTPERGPWPAGDAKKSGRREASSH